MYTLTFSDPIEGLSTASLPFTLDKAMTGGPYVGAATATSGGATVMGDVIVGANSTNGEINFSGLSEGTTYTIAPGRIEVTYGGNDRRLVHTGISFDTKTDDPKVATESMWADLASKVKAKADSSNLATVATSGSYNDLTNKPTIPTVNNATLTIQRNGTSVGTFTANASSNRTINIAVPTATSDLTNDSGFITSITKITNAEIDAIMGVS